MLKYSKIVELAIAACLLVSTPAWANDDADKIVPKSIEELEAAIKDVMQETGVPALGLAIVDENGPVWVESLGKANIESDTDATTESMFRIGSTSKMFVALSVLKLVEEGRLSLDDKLTDLAPEIVFENRWAASDPVRVVHLLEHTTGWDDVHLPEYAHNDPTPATLKEGLDFHPHSRRSRWKPGTRTSYCNAGPPIAAYIVQKITGLDFEDYVQQNFFDPMAMDTITYRLSPDVEAHGVTSYKGDEPQEYWHIFLRPSGAINASPVDMAKFVRFFVDRGKVDGTALISETSLTRMETVGSTPAAAAGQHSGYALNNYSSIFEQWDFRSHNGGVDGGLTELSYLPSAKRGYAFMINSGSGKASGAISDLIRRYLTHDLEKPAGRAAIDLGPQHEALAGLYRSINPRQEVARFMEYVFGIQKFYVDGSKLTRKGLLGGEATNYLPVADNLFMDEASGFVTMSSVEDPLAGPVIHAGTLVLQPVSSLVVYSQLAIAALWVLSIAISMLYFLVWGVRRLRGKVPAGGSIRIRVWPLLAGLSVVLFVAVFISGFGDPFGLLGKPTLVSVTIMIASLAFAVFALLGLLSAWRERATPMNRLNYWYSTTSSFLHVVVALYLLSFGVIGIMTWS